MNQQEEARERARLTLAWADGKTLQLVGQPKEWIDYTGKKAPVIHSSSFWRVKPEPRLMWTTERTSSFSTDNWIRTFHQSDADVWKAKGSKVTKWQEVVS